MVLLFDIEDRLLAMCEGDPVTIRLAQHVLGVWYERAIGRTEVLLKANRLAKLGLLRWQYPKQGKRYLTKRFPVGIERKLLTFQATQSGEAYLVKPRAVDKK